MARAGGTSPVKEATAEVQEIIEKIKDQVLSKVNHTLDKYEAVSFKTQVVSGLNYFIKVRTGDDSFIHLRVYRPLPFGNEKLELHGVQEHKSKEEELEYF